jgi:kynureninase
VTELATDPLTRERCAALDATDPLASLRDRFRLPDDVVYLDGNSLGAPPRAAAERVERLLDEEWGRGLIRSWNEAGWIEAPRRLGDKLGRLIGAGPGQVVVSDSTTVNLFKLLTAALRARPGRRVILSERDNFPTDLYVAEGVARDLDAVLRTVDRGELESAIDESVAVLMLTHVDYRTGFMHDMGRLTEAAHAAGVLALWDLSHSIAAVPLAVDEWGVDLAAGCGYKHLCGGPGAPAHLYVASRLQEEMPSAIQGWMGHADTFSFDAGYRPAPGVMRHLCGTPPMLAMAALEAAVDLFGSIDMAAVRRKSVALGDLLIRLVDERLADRDLLVASPRESARRGSQVSLSHPNGYRVMRALIDRGVIGDFRPPDLMRFGLAPLYIRHVDIWDAVQTLREVLDGELWRDRTYAARATVT